MNAPESAPHITTASNMEEVEAMVKIAQTQHDLFAAVDKVFDAAGSDAVIRSVPAHKGIPMMGHRPVVGTTNVKGYRRWPALVAAERVCTNDADFVHFMLIADGRPFQRPLGERNYDYGQPFGTQGKFYGVIEASLNRTDPTDVSLGGRCDEEEEGFGQIEVNPLFIVKAVTEIAKGFTKAIKSNAKACDPPLAAALTGPMEHPYVGRR